MNAVEPLDGERGIPEIGQNGSGAARRAVIQIAFVVVCLGIVGVVAWRYAFASAQGDAVEQKPMPTAQASASRTFDSPAPLVAEPPEPDPEPAAPIDSPVAPPPEPETYVPYTPETYAPAPAPRVIDKTAGDLMTGLGRAAAAAGAAVPRVTDGGMGSMFGGERNTDDSVSDLSSRLNSTSFAPAVASRLPNPGMTIATGTLIGCVLQTRLVSTVPGLSSCRVTDDVYSVDGNVKLIEEGTIATGEYRSNIRQGQAVIFMAWQRLRTPGHVIIDIASPATGPLGEAGLSGDIDTHFWQRFGGAFLLSLVSDVARNVGPDDSTVVQSGTSAGSQAVGDVLASTVNIPPTLSKNQGDRVGIYVARDLDFSTVYALEAVR